MINEAILTSEKPLKVKVTAISGQIARLKFSDNQSVEINSKYLPENVKIGEELYLNLLTETDLQKTKGQIAKEILENILESENS